MQRLADDSRFEVVAQCSGWLNMPAQTISAGRVRAPPNGQCASLLASSTPCKMQRCSSPRQLARSSGLLPKSLDLAIDGFGVQLNLVQLIGKNLL